MLIPFKAKGVGFTFQKLPPLAPYLHHCFSHGMPSLFPSIFTPGQLRRKNVASSHEVICEQCVRPSHLKLLDEGVSAG